MILNAYKNKIIAINKKIRAFSEEQSIYDYEISSIPLGGSIKDSIGPWPEYILHGIKCHRSEAGLCSPCGYSHDGYSQRKLIDLGIDAKNCINNQAINVMNSFKKGVIERQFYDIQNEKKIFFAFTTVGSFFSDVEMSFENKLNILKKLHDLKTKEGVDICFITEVHAQDIINYEKNGKLNILTEILNSLNTVVILGFESIDDFSRNYLYCKDLTVQDFELAVDILKKHNIYPAAFVFVGSHTLLQKEIIDDFKNTVQYLYGLSVIPVVMVANLKIGTLEHLLFTLTDQRLVEPRTVEIILKILKENEKSLYPFPWLIADPVGGPPEPLVHSFNNAKMWSCKDCSYNIIAALRYLRKTYDWKGYERILSPEVQDCTCRVVYEQQIDLENKIAMGKEERLKKAIDIADSNMNRYFDFLIRQKNNSNENES